MPSVRVELAVVGTEYRGAAEAATGSGMELLGSVVTEEWPPPPALVARDPSARAELQVLRRTRPARILRVYVTSRRMVQTVEDGVVNVFAIHQLRGVDASDRVSNANATEFHGGMFVAGQWSGTIAGFDWDNGWGEGVQPTAVRVITAPPPVVTDREKPGDPGECNEAIAPRDPCERSGSWADVVETFSLALRGTIADRDTDPSAWNVIDRLELERDEHATGRDAFRLLPARIQFDDRQRRPVLEADLRTYALRLVVETAIGTFEGEPGSPVHVHVLPVPPGETEPYVVIDHGPDAYGRSLIEVAFDGPVERSGLFEVGWAIVSDGASEFDDETVVERLLPGPIGAQPLDAGSSLFELVDASASVDDRTAVYVGVRRTDRAGQKGPYRVVEAPVFVRTPGTVR